MAGHWCGPSSMRPPEITGGRRLSVQEDGRGWPGSTGSPGRGAFGVGTPRKDQECEENQGGGGCGLGGLMLAAGPRVLRFGLADRRAGRTKGIEQPGGGVQPSDPTGREARWIMSRRNRPEESERRRKKGQQNNWSKQSKLSLPEGVHRFRVTQPEVQAFPSRPGSRQTPVAASLPSLRTVPGRAFLVAGAPVPVSARSKGGR
jgi:hypothetical protein